MSSAPHTLLLLRHLLLRLLLEVIIQLICATISWRLRHLQHALPWILRFRMSLWRDMKARDMWAPVVEKYKVKKKDSLCADDGDPV